MAFYNNLELLIDGKNAFPVILDCIKNAKKSIYINMFIWRDDNIGNIIGEAVLEAANRGVKVDISKDKYGVVLEKSEEVKKSFFHKQQTLSEKIKYKTLELFYPMKNTPKNGKDFETDLYLKIMHHPNINISKDIFKADHSKYYIFDDEVLIMGGVNIEDKENGKDFQGRFYQDYMIKFNGKEYVESFKNKYKNKENNSVDLFYGINYKEESNKYFEMEKLYLDMINSSQKELTIVMAYFSPLKEFIDAILNAHDRGVKVRILTSKEANYQNDSNYKTLKKLLKESNNGIDVYLSPKMVHTKMIINDQYISLGSTNITKKAFNQLDELNAFMRIENHEFVNCLFNSVEEHFNISSKVENYKELRYNKFTAFIEGFLV